MALTKYVVKVPLVGRFIPLVGGIGRLVESPLQCFPPSNNIAFFFFICMELLSPHKMAEMRPAHGNDRLPDSRI